MVYRQGLTEGEGKERKGKEDGNERDIDHSRAISSNIARLLSKAPTKKRMRSGAETNSVSIHPQWTNLNLPRFGAGDYTSVQQTHESSKNE